MNVRMWVFLLLICSILLVGCGEKELEPETIVLTGLHQKFFVEASSNPDNVILKVDCAMSEITVAPNMNISHMIVSGNKNTLSTGKYVVVTKLDITGMDNNLMFSQGFHPSTFNTGANNVVEYEG